MLVNVMQCFEIMLIKVVQTEVVISVNILYFLFQYRALAPMYYRGAAAAIVVYDITREVGHSNKYL